MNTKIEKDLKYVAVEIVLKNTGLGPAILRDFSIYDKLIKKEFRREEIASELKKHFSDFSLTFSNPDSSLMAGNEFSVLEIPLLKDISDTGLGCLQKKWDERFEIRVKYESFAGEKFFYSSDHN